MMFIETSAKEKTGVMEAYEELVNKIVESPLINEVCLEEKRKKLRDLGSDTGAVSGGQGCSGYCT